MSSSLRRRRWRALEQAFPDIAEMRVVDLGGTASSWLASPLRPRHVTLLNRVPSPERELPTWVDHVVGDACDLSPEMEARRFDLVYSNSVIEHVGGHDRRIAFARSVEVLAPAHWVQTPYRYFPVEPHWLFPGFQFLPVSVRTDIAMRWPLYKWRTSDRAHALREVQEIELLSKTEFAAYFPHSMIVPERFMGLTKSFIAVRSSPV
ncbi:MAG: class I SAM-dependent methyltransferase [Acidimicrobiales bacterium]